MIATNLFVSPGDGGGNSQLVRFVYGAPAYLVHILPVGLTPDLTVDALFDPDRGILVQIQLVGDVAYVLPISTAAMSSN